MQQRSTAVTVIGWIFMALAAFGLLNCLVLLFTPIDQVIAQLPKNADAIKFGPELLGSVMRGVFFFMFAVFAWALLSAVGLVMRKPWARISVILLLGLGIFWNLLYVLIGVSGGPAGMGALMQGLGGALAVMGAILVVIFSSIIYLLTRDKTKREFAASTKS
ncbi:MAG TPA: hypothetical protein VGH91_09235 [Gammaproteobacteria bacterium]|jgi:hypothetical protein